MRMPGRLGICRAERSLVRRPTDRQSCSCLTALGVAGQQPAIVTSAGETEARLAAVVRTRRTKRLRTKKMRVPSFRPQPWPPASQPPGIQARRVRRRARPRHRGMQQFQSTQSHWSQPPPRLDNDGYLDVPVEATETFSWRATKFIGRCARHTLASCGFSQRA